MNKPHLTDFLFRELPESEVDDLKQHIQSDPDLQRQLDRGQQLLEELERPLDDLPLKTAEDIMATIRSQRESTRRSPFAPRAALVGAGLLLLMFLTRPGTEPNSNDILNPAVAKAAGWLLSRQEPSGQWNASRWGGDARFAPGLTALALLALPPQEGPENPAVTRGCNWLIKKALAPGPMGPDDQSTAYNRVLTLMALLDRGQLDEPTGRAISQLIGESLEDQDDSGGWGYGPHVAPNSALTSWQVLALVKARSLGVHKLDTSITRASNWLAGTLDQRGRAGYEKAGHFPNGPEGLTAMTHLALRICGRSNLALPTLSPDSDELDFTEAFFMASVDGDQRIELQQKIERAQIQKGPQRGSWRPDDPWGSAGGRVYATALAALTLQTGR